uniref:Uncharacterized protein n=1 Tax=Ixodes ricinus TaxID=34613 RepID=A0A6B0U5G3_IXORI
MRPAANSCKLIVCTFRATCFSATSASVAKCPEWATFRNSLTTSHPTSSRTAPTKATRRRWSCRAARRTHLTRIVRAPRCSDSSTESSVSTISAATPTS